jgi:hypothetical protein
MIFRLLQKLNTNINPGTMATMPLDQNPFADLKPVTSLCACAQIRRAYLEAVHAKRKKGRTKQ